MSNKEGCDMILSRQLVSRGQVAMSWVGSGCSGNAVNGMGCVVLREQNAARVEHENGK